ncbi:uncharacterized protein LOC143876022 [Tasmannia lanceolata]|uniref:uncharacterized protein LOC143876022 n=1 Tax=Tasmannia lanceolata TaxID=3420 RepID=UPI004063309F
MDLNRNIVKSFRKRRIQVQLKRGGLKFWVPYLICSAIQKSGVEEDERYDQTCVRVESQEVRSDLQGVGPQVLLVHGRLVLLDLHFPHHYLQTHHSVEVWRCMTFGEECPDL